MTREFKVGDKIKMSEEGKEVYLNEDTNPHNGEGVITSIEGIWTRVTWGNDKCNSYELGDLYHIKPVAIGYTGKLNDMDLQDGDVVSNVNFKYTVINQSVLEHSFDLWVIDFTLISRANDTKYTVWSKWHISKECGTMGIKFDDVEKAKLAKCVQFAYRGRNVIKSKPVITTELVKGHWDTSLGEFLEGKPLFDDEYDCTITLTLDDGKPVSLVGTF